jgi:hypothetical protein
MRRSTFTAAAVLVLAPACLTACSGASASKTSAHTSAAGSSNERRLTRTQSLQLVSWAQSFRRCMLAGGTRVGELAKTETRISMGLPAGVTALGVVPAMTACGDKQGGPPQKSSLQYRDRGDRPLPTEAVPARCEGRGDVMPVQDLTSRPLPPGARRPSGAVSSNWPCLQEFSRLR